MKKKTPNLLFLFPLIICFLISCSTNTKSTQDVRTFDKFPITLHLSHEEIQTEANLYCIGGLLLLDSILVSVDLKADTFFHVFKLPLFDYQGSFIKRGPGPEEEIFIYPFIGRVSESEFLYNGVSSIKIAKYNHQTNKLEIVEQINLPPDLFEIWNSIKLGDSIISNKATGVMDEKYINKEFIGYNLQNKEIFDFGAEYPFVGEYIESHLKDVIFGKTNVLKPDGSAFATVYDKFPILRIYTNTGEIKKEVRLENGQSFPYALIEEDPSTYSFNEIMQNYRMIRSSNNFIYALYIGKREQELDEGLNDFSNEIHVWNWEGEPIQRILLDEKIFTFDVDLHDNYLICSSLLSLNALYKYNLK